MSKVRIDVSLDDIGRGERCKFENCPVARAAGRAFPDFEPGVSDGWLRLYRPDTLDPAAAILPLPDVALSFIRAFDSGCAVEPFSFEVDRPC